MVPQLQFKRIVFYFPCHDIGGGQLLFIRYAEAMAKNYSDKEILFVDYVDGFARNQLISIPNIRFIDYVDGNKTLIPPHSVVVYTLNHLWHFREKMSFDANNTSFIFWCIAFHDIYIPRYIISKSTRKAIGDELIWLSQKGIIRYLGPLAHEILAKQYNVSPVTTDSIPLVVPTSKYAVDYKVERELGDVVRFCWLGRLDTDKYNDIVTYMNELERLNQKQKVSLSFIGRGNAETQIELLSKKFSYPCNFVGEKRDETLDSYIRNSVDIGLASGTSSLEFALRKVPIVHGTKLSKVYQAGECFLFSDVDKGRDLYNFQTIYNGIVSEYWKKCDESFTFAMSKSPTAGAKKMHDAITHLESLEWPEVYTHLLLMSRLLAKGHERNKKLDYIRKIKKTVMEFHEKVKRKYEHK